MSALSHTLDTIRALIDIPEERLTGISPGAWADIIRHLVDVVGRQRAMLVECQWADRGYDGDPMCPRCGGYEGGHGHEADCDLDALLRKTK